METGPFVVLIHQAVDSTSFEIFNTSKDHIIFCLRNSKGHPLVKTRYDPQKKRAVNTKSRGGKSVFFQMMCSSNQSLYAERVTTTDDSFGLIPTFYLGPIESVPWFLLVKTLRNFSRARRKTFFQNKPRVSIGESKNQSLKNTSPLPNHSSATGSSIHTRVRPNCGDQTTSSSFTLSAMKTWCVRNRCQH